MPPDQATSSNQVEGPNGLIERQVTKELLELFDIDERTLNTQGLQITTTIDPDAQKAAEDAASKYLDGQDPTMRTAVVSIDPKSGRSGPTTAAPTRRVMTLRRPDCRRVRRSRSSPGRGARAGNGPGLPRSTAHR